MFLQFYVSNMVLAIDSDAAYLVIPKVKIRITRYYQITNYQSKINKLQLNSTILVECKALEHIVLSFTEVKTAGVFHNTQIAILI